MKNEEETSKGEATEVMSTMLMTGYIWNGPWDPTDRAPYVEKGKKRGEGLVSL